MEGERSRETERDTQSQRWTEIQRARQRYRETGDPARRPSRAGRPWARVSSWLCVWAPDGAEEDLGRGIWAGAKGGLEFVNSCAGGA